MTELFVTAIDLMSTEAAASVATAGATAGGFLLKETGKVALGVLIRPRIVELLNRYRKFKSEGAIPEDFEDTPHGAALLQEALNALLNGLEEERAEAVKRVFLGLAMNPVTDSMDRVEQLEIMRITSELTAWEIILINAMERFKVQVFDATRSEQFSLAQPEKRDQVRQVAARESPKMDEWLSNFCSGDKYRFGCLKSAIDSLSAKRILNRNLANMAELAVDCVVRPDGAFSTFGRKLAMHLYSAKDA